MLATDGYERYNKQPNTRKMKQMMDNEMKAEVDTSTKHGNNPDPELPRLNRHQRRKLEAIMRGVNKKAKKNK